tara:strand:+ start:1961 stop:2641 length:681 start_codon:yes stop_codon:yes gene_type:complete
MRVAVQIPIKYKTSTRVPDKNFRELNGKPLGCWLLDELTEKCPNEWDIYIDSESEKTFTFFEQKYDNRLKFHKREEWYASDEANGNHLINQFVIKNPDYDLYIQLFVTAVTLTGEVISASVEKFINSLDKYDSMFLVTRENGWVWYNKDSVNYNYKIPNGLPRTQDANYFKETTGLYAITKEAVLKYATRIGSAPLLFEVEEKHALDIDTMEDFYKSQNILPREKK